MTGEPEPSGEAPPGRRESWSLRSIVLDVSGHSLEEYQDPERTPHPYLRVKPPADRAHPPPAPAAHAGVRTEPPDDPVARVYPPLTGSLGRSFHGPEHEHHAELLARGHEGAPSSRPDSPSRRPERVYLHYLLLHLDRLSDHALRYLHRAVEEEVAHRAEPPAPLTPPS
ncbi:MAG TPA: hypothetical protein VGS23_09905 [Thermoplasmata archaeon]|nr:hypothetical protein [Thermoplasmata archaeon]